MDFTRLWADKYRPQTIDDLSYNEELSKTLRQLAESSDLPHLIFYGPPGVGKKTRVMCLLNEIYGKGVYKYTKEMWKRKLNSTGLLSSKLFVRDKVSWFCTDVEVPMLTSKYHIDLTPSDAGHHDKFVVQTLIKETASSGNAIQPTGKSQKDFMTIVFNESEKISKEAQASLRRTMEKYVTKCRLILICENLGNLIPALLSRCFLIRCRAPNEDEISAGLVKVIQEEQIKFDDDQMRKLMQDPSRNMRRAIMALQNECIKAKASKQLGTLVDWKLSITNIVNQITKSQTPATLKAVRCYDLL